MLYLDVSSSCKSPMNTGVQRVIRALYRALSALTPVTPLIWDKQLAAYCTLSRAERGFLLHPFGPRNDARGGHAEPGRRANPIPFWSKLARTLSHRRNRLDLPARLTSADAVFVPEIFQDNRIDFFARLAASRAPAPLAAVCHDALPWSHPEVTPLSRLAEFEPYLAALGSFGHIVTCSRETSGDLRRFWRETGTVSPAGALPAVSVHPWPVDHDGTPRRVTPPPALSGGGAVRPSVLCVGTFEPRKNHLGLLDAAERVWQGGAAFELLLVGRTTAAFGAQVCERIDALARAGRPVRWLRHVDDATLLRAYEQCAFTVFPSLFEGFGIPILESLWHGRPCVCGGNGAIGEVAAGGGCLVVDQTDPAALAAGIERLLADTPFYQRLCAEADRREFGTWDALARQLLPIFGLGT